MSRFHVAIKSLSLVTMLAMCAPSYAAQTYETCGLNTRELVLIAMQLTQGKSIEEMKTDDAIHNKNVATVARVIEKKGLTDGLLSIMAFYAKCSIGAREQFAKNQTEKEKTYFRCAYQSAVEFKVLHHIRQGDDIQKVSASMPENLKPVIDMLYQLGTQDIDQAIKYSLQSDTKCIEEALVQFRK